MTLPCLAFETKTVSSLRNGSEVVFRARASALGVVGIKSRQNLVGLCSPCLVLWIGSLLGRHAAENIAEIAPDEDEAPELGESPSYDSFPDLASGASDADPLDDVESLPSPAIPLMDEQMRCLAWLGQPFGALLLALTRWNMAEYKRIVTECPDARDHVGDVEQVDTRCTSVERALMLDEISTVIP